MSRKSSLTLIAVLFGTFAVLLACGEAGSTGSVVSGGTHTSTTTPSHFKVGQAVKLGDYTVTVNSIKTSQGGQFDTLKAGDVFAVVDVTIKNGSSKAQSFSSDLAFTFQDTTGQKYTQAIVSDGTPPDGTISAGGLLKGQITYEVPKAQHTFTLAFQGDILSTDQAIWDLKV